MNVSALPSSSSARKKVFIAYMQLTTPNDPAMAVSTAMSTLRNLPQLKVVVCVVIFFSND